MRWLVGCPSAVTSMTNYNFNVHYIYLIMYQSISRIIIFKNSVTVFSSVKDSFVISVVHLWSSKSLVRSFPKTLCYWLISERNDDWRRVHQRKCVRETREFPCGRRHWLRMKDGKSNKSQSPMTYEATKHNYRWCIILASQKYCENI